MALTTLEFDLMAARAQPHRVMSREHLLEEAAGRTWSPYDRAVDTAMSSCDVRSKMTRDA